MTDELTISKDQLLLDCMHELTKVKNEHSTTRATLSKVQTELAETKINLAKTNADFDTLHQEIGHLRHRRLTQHSKLMRRMKMSLMLKEITMMLTSLRRHGDN